MIYLSMLIRIRLTLTASVSIRNPQTFNRYAYALNSPYKFTDLLGLIPSSTGACGAWCQNNLGMSGEPMSVDGSAFRGRDASFDWAREWLGIVVGYALGLPDGSVYEENLITGTSRLSRRTRQQGMAIGHGNVFDAPNASTTVDDNDLNLEVENNEVVLTFYLQSRELLVQGEVNSNGDREEFIIEGVTSGRGNCMNNPECARDRNVGPIPAGAYYLRVSKPDEVGTIRAWLRSWTSDWGSFRVPLIPLAGTNIDDSNGKKRDGFKLHGGNSPGSAGCIDVGGGYCGNDSTRRLLQVIRSDSSQKVIVYVLYTRRIQ